MGGSRNKQTQTTTQRMPGNQQDVVDTMLQGALQNFRQGGREFFPGDVVADFNPNQTEGQNRMLNFSGGVGSDMISDAINANSFFMDPNRLFDMSSIPGFNATEDRLVNTATDNLTRNILPSIRSGAIASGMFGGTPQGVGEGLATGETNRGITDSLANLYLGAYGQGLDSFNRSIDRAPGLFNLGLQPGMLQESVGASRQNQAQNEIQGQVARHEFEQNEPAFQLQLLRQLGGNFGDFGGTTSTVSEQQTKPSGLNQALGAGLSLASLWNPMTSVFAGLGKTAMNGAPGTSGFGIV